MMKVIIGKLIYGGKGMSRIDNKVCFVPYVLPSEKVEVKIIKEKKNHMECEPVKILKPSPDRVEPACGYFTYCGGCDYLHIKYQKQVEFKNSILSETLERIGGLKEIPIKKPVPSIPDLYYRNRVQFKVRGDKVGFYKKGSKEVVNIQHCLLIKEELNTTLEGIRKVLPFFNFQPDGIHLHHGSEGHLTVRFLFRKPLKRIPLGLKHMRAFLGENLEGFGIYHSNGLFPKRLNFIGSPFVYEKVGDYKFRVSADSFFQINRFQVGNLIQMVEEIVKDKPVSTAVDLYSGVGTFTIPIARYVDRVFGVEINPYAVQDANHNKKLNNTPNVFFYRADASEILQFLSKKEPELLLIDPPRAGIGKTTLETILLLKKLKKLIYLSCNPPTLARDSAILIQNGFTLKEIRLIDMFPHTHHIESISLFER